jgi:hypothetical protein
LTTFAGHFLGPGTHSSRPATTGLPEGTMYVCTTHAKIERVVSGAWTDYATLGTGTTPTTITNDTIWDSKGDLAAASGADAAGKLVVGSNGQVLTADSAQTLGIKWAAPTVGSVSADGIWDTKGDLAAATGADTAAKLAAGANGYRLEADSAQTTGLKWAPPSKEWALKIVDDATALTTGEDKLHIFLPSSVNGYNLTAVFAGVSTVSSSGAPSIGIRNVTDSVEMLSTNLTIDASEKTSATAATAAVIDAAHDDVATGDEISVDIDTAGTGAKGLQVILTFTLP